MCEWFSPTMLLYCSLLINYRKSKRIGVWARISVRKSSPFLIISLETCVTDDFMNRNRNLVKPTQSYISTQTQLYFVLSKVLITTLDRKGLENRFNIFLRHKKITWKSIKIRNNIMYTKYLIKRTFNFMDSASFKRSNYSFVFWYL